MILLALHWLPDLWGRLHPLAVHFPIGLLAGALVLESWDRLRKKETDYSGIVYLGALMALISAAMGGVLRSSGEYVGQIVDQHQWSGYLTAGLALVTALIYRFRGQLPRQLPYTALILSNLCLGIAGHLGASLTHGDDYLSAVLPWNQRSSLDPSRVEAFQVFAALDSFPQDQLDQLNLEVRAVFAHNCYQCHSTAKRKGGLALDHEEGVFEGGENGPVLVSGSASESELVRRLRLPRSHDDAMPPKGKVLAAEEIELIELWIDQGAHWADASLKVFREAELELIQPALPPAAEGITHPVDRFVHSYFAEQGLEWPEPVDDRQFIRRAYLDVTGLLPPPEAIKAFSEDNDPEKRPALIRELLDDKQNYALHWLSFWNDLLRNDYSGTGFITGGRKQVTEWLYRALMDDKPYNEMVAELINPTPASEGFIKGIQWRGEVNASQRTELQAAQNISQSLLGLNLKCASCHDSFVNNLTLDQAYGFANIFAEAPMEIYRCDKPTGRMAETAFLYPQLGEVVSDSLKGRLRELAGILVKPENGRLYRTLVNRFWDRLFGRGIIAPVDEMDKLPWNQHLLDWLAAEFIANGYDLRQLLELIMNSRAYQLPAFAYPSPEYLASETFVFRGPAVRQLTAEQFVDAFGQVVTPMYHGMAFDPAGRDMEAQWIWHKEVEVDRVVLPKPGTRFFRKSFSLNRGQRLSNAELLVTADQSFSLFFNGTLIGRGDDWRAVQRFQLPVDLLREENTIAVEGRNTGTVPNPAGLLFSLRLQFADSSLQFVHSDPTWRTSADTALTENWTLPGFDDSDWPEAWRAGNFRNSYWGILPEFTFEKDTTPAFLVRASLVRQDDFMKTLGRPVRENVVTSRSAEATLLQSLMLSNSAFFHENIARGARAWIEGLGDDPDKLLDQLYLNALGRLPTRKEKKILFEQWDREEKTEAVEDIIWALVLLPEFQLI